MSSDGSDIKGLSDEEVTASRAKYGFNRLEFKKENGFLNALKNIFLEPMVILLLVTSSIYFVSGKSEDGFFLVSAIVLVSAISLYQDSRSRNALEKLKKITEPICKVIRNSKVQEIPSEDLVVGDYLIVEEGGSIAADGVIIHSNDFSVNESILTGESMPLSKDENKKDQFVFAGTTVVRGQATATVTAIGNATKLGKIGKSIESIKEEKTPLEIQINHFVKKMVLIGAIVFGSVWAINYFQSFDVLLSLLKALTLAMSIIPEEIPVAFTTFMALGAWRLMKMGIVVKQMKTVETLGSATVICIDKTGTITKNKMSLAKLFALKTNKITSPDSNLNSDEIKLIEAAMWASEPTPFDFMEVALHNIYKNKITKDERTNYKIIHEYPLEGKPPMMTHVFENKTGSRIISAKGAPEAFMEICNLSDQQKEQIDKAILLMTAEGYRVLGVAEGNFESSDFPKKQQDLPFVFIGLVAFYDPPKKNIKEVLQGFYTAGITVKIITGDNSATTAAIAKQIGFLGCEKKLTGDELMQLSESDLQLRVLDTNIFTRMFPEAKLKIINALKAKGEIVAMTGDGVNDGPALKAAHIGIAMGKKGTEIAKQSASLILLEDDLSLMVEAIAMGRKIYSNLKKAIQYIISIHIPIILTVFIPLILGWVYPAIFSPIHIIFLELIMGPTCSIIYENEPIEKNTMLQKPRPFTTTFFKWKELLNSIVQGLVITAGTLIIYQYCVYKNYNEELTRTMVFFNLLASNIFLTLVNRSFYFSVTTTLKYKNNLVFLIIGITITLSCLLLYLKPLNHFFSFEHLNPSQLLISVGIAFLSVIWFELVKWKKRLKEKT